MEQLYPLVCLPSRDEDESQDMDQRGADTAVSPANQPQDDEMMTGLDPEVWTKPLTKQQWEAACAMIMYFATHGGC